MALGRDALLALPKSGLRKVCLFIRSYLLIVSSVCTKPHLTALLHPNSALGASSGTARAARPGESADRPPWEGGRTCSGRLFSEGSLLTREKSSPSEKRARATAVLGGARTGGMPLLDRLAVLGTGTRLNHSLGTAGRGFAETGGRSLGGQGGSFDRISRNDFRMRPAGGTPERRLGPVCGICLFFLRAGQRAENWTPFHIFRKTKIELELNSSNKGATPIQGPPRSPV